MMLSEKGQFPLSFFILLSQCQESFAPKLTNFHIFASLLSFNMACFAKIPYLTARHKLNYKIGCT